MKKRVLLIATLDTKGREAAYVKECIESTGVEALLMDIGTLLPPHVRPDITRYELAEAAGYNLREVASGKDRSGAVRAVEEGGVLVAGRLHKEGRIDGVFGMGGGTGTAVVTRIMRALPFGVPKLVVSTVASRDIRQFIETKDIVMFHSVADLLGFNEFIRLILAQASHAISAMVAAGSTLKEGRPMVAVTAYGINSVCAALAEPILVAKGYEMIGFHANGCGGMAMEEMISQGLISGVLDLTPHEIADEMFGGYCRGIGPSRLETAGKVGVPLVFAPGGLDNAVFSPHYPMPEALEGRKMHAHDERFCVRMGPEEMVKFAGIVAERLNGSRGPVHVLIPVKGWSEADKEGMALFDPHTDSIFVAALRKVLKPSILIEEMDVHISEPSFAERAVTILDGMMKKTGIR
jgi:uncharacterized protein (UPF0261 family)